MLTEDELRHCVLFIDCVMVVPSLSSLPVSPHSACAEQSILQVQIQYRATVRETTGVS